MTVKYKVVKTPCFPNAWKCESIKWPGTDNSTSRYHPTKEEAQQQVDKFNEIYKDSV